MKVFFQNQAEEYSPEVDYVIEFIANHPFAKDWIAVNERSSADIAISYGDASGFDLVIPEQKRIFSKKEVDPFQLNAIKYQFNGKPLYSVELNEDVAEREFVTYTNSTTYISFDIIECTYFHLTRYEEYKATEQYKDDLGRIVESNLFNIRNGIEKRPIVDDLVETFLTVLGIHPYREKVKLILTHDIDHVKAFKQVGSVIKRAAIMYYRGSKVSTIMKMFATYRSVLFKRQKDPYSTTSFISDAGIEKHIFLLVGGTHKYDTPLNLIDTVVKDMIEAAKANGYQFGIHPSISASRCGDLWKAEKNLLEENLGFVLTQSRQHYLCYDFEHTLSFVEQNGIKRDFTIGYGKYIGYRSGTATDHKMYNFKERRPYRFLSNPLTIMDTSLWFESGGDVNMFEEIWNQFHRLNKDSAQITYNFHNSSFYDLSCFGLDLHCYYKQISSES